MPPRSLWSDCDTRPRHADPPPGTYVRIETTGLDEFQQLLLAKKYKYARPGIQQIPWGTREMTIGDPFRNQLIFVAID